MFKGGARRRSALNKDRNGSGYLGLGALGLQDEALQLFGLQSTTRAKEKTEAMIG